MARHVRRIRRKRRVNPPGSAVFTPARAAICAGALVLGFAVGLFLLTYGPEAYNGWRETRLLKRASAMLARRDEGPRSPGAEGAGGSGSAAGGEELEPRSGSST